MTARVGVLQKIYEWVAAMGAKPEPPPAPRPVEEPLLRLPRLLMGTATLDGLRQNTVQLVVDALNSQNLTCKSPDLLQEGMQLSLDLLLQGVGPVKLRVEVEWVLLSSFGHSLGLKVLHAADSDTAQQLQQFIQLTRENSRG